MPQDKRSSLEEYQETRNEPLENQEIKESTQEQEDEEIKESAPVFCSSASLADILGITRRHLYNLTKAKIITSPEKRDVWDVKTNVREFLKYRELIGSDTKERAEILKRKDLADARLKELVFKIKASEYIPLLEVEKELEDMAFTISSKMQSIPDLLEQKYKLDASLKNELINLIQTALSELKPDNITKITPNNVLEFEQDQSI